MGTAQGHKNKHTQKNYNAALNARKTKGRTNERSLSSGQMSWYSVSCCFCLCFSLELLPYFIKGPLDTAPNKRKKVWEPRKEVNFRRDALIICLFVLCFWPWVLTITVKKIFISPPRPSHLTFLGAPRSLELNERLHGLPGSRANYRWGAGRCEYGLFLGFRVPSLRTFPISLSLCTMMSLFTIIYFYIVSFFIFLPWLIYSLLLTFILFLLS